MNKFVAVNRRPLSKRCREVSRRTSRQYPLPRVLCSRWKDDSRSAIMKKNNAFQLRVQKMLPCQQLRTIRFIFCLRSSGTFAQKRE